MSERTRDEILRHLLREPSEPRVQADPLKRDFMRELRKVLEKK